MKECTGCFLKLFEVILFLVFLTPLFLWLFNVGWFMTFNRFLMFFLIILGNISALILFKWIYKQFSKKKNKYEQFLKFLEEFFFAVGASTVSSSLVVGITDPSKIFLAGIVLFDGFLLIVMSIFYKFKFWR